MIETRLVRAVTIRADNAAAALEAMSRFAVNPKWLIHLPPTMSPSEISARQDHLEHPDEALAHFRGNGVARVVCEEKHTGSRAIVVVCADEEAARRRLGVIGEGFGLVYRTGRRFLSDPALETALVARVRDAARAAGLFDELPPKRALAAGE